MAFAECECLSAVCPRHFHSRNRPCSSRPPRVRVRARARVWCVWCVCVCARVYVYTVYSVCSFAFPCPKGDWRRALLHRGVSRRDGGEESSGRGVSLPCTVAQFIECCTRGGGAGVVHFRLSRPLCAQIYIYIIYVCVCVYIYIYIFFFSNLYYVGSKYLLFSREKEG